MVKKNKKGSLADPMQIGLILATLAVIILISFKVSDELNDRFQTHPAITTDARDTYSEINNMYSGVIDNSMLYLALGISVIALILAMLVRIHPVFFIFYMMLLPVVIFLSAVFSNIYLEMANHPDFLDVANRLTFTSHIMGALPYLVGIIGIVLAIIMYKNWKADR